ncbi:universal stress protein family protein [Stenotrophomonas rhizophila]|uniref:Universal stress protein family protein n=2 Tax=Stenotrophomonas rhizophila TaxID=216778 RepID=A0A498CIF7_9GAMM|nr:universal stress protein family protein [Stenotrophomonas rhizophila]
MPTMKDIAVLFDESHYGLHVLDAAARLAGRQGGHLIGVTALNHDPVPIHDGFAKGGALTEVVALRQSSMAARVLNCGQNLTKAVQQHGVDGELRVISYVESSSESSLHALYCDLLVLASPDIPGTPQTWSAQSMLRHSGIPILIVPRAWQDREIGRRIVVAWNGSRQARRAIADSLPLLTKAEEVKLLIVDPERTSDLLGDEPGADMASFLARHDVRVELVRLPAQGARVADVILNYAAASGVDLVVFGAYSHARLTESLMGGVTRTLLAGASIPLFVSQ